MVVLLTLTNLLPLIPMTLTPLILKIPLPIPILLLHLPPTLLLLTLILITRLLLPSLAQFDLQFHYRHLLMGQYSHQLLLPHLKVTLFSSILSEL